MRHVVCFGLAALTFAGATMADAHGPCIRNVQMQSCLVPSSGLPGTNVTIVGTFAYRVVWNLDVPYFGDRDRVALTLRKVGFSSDILHGLGLAPIIGSVSLWGKSAAHADKAKKARSERLAIFVGLWPPTFFLLGKVLQDLEADPEEQAAHARGKAVG